LVNDSLAVTPSDLVAGGAAFAAAAQQAAAGGERAGQLAFMVAATPGPGGGIGGMAAHLADVISRACQELALDATGHGSTVAAAGGLYAATDQAATSRFAGSTGLPGHPAI
jgi:hypothetical protein